MKKPLIPFQTLMPLMLALGMALGIIADRLEIRQLQNSLVKSSKQLARQYSEFLDSGPPARDEGMARVVKDGSEPWRTARRYHVVTNGWRWVVLLDPEENVTDQSCEPGILPRFLQRRDELNRSNDALHSTNKWREVWETKP